MSSYFWTKLEDQNVHKWTKKVNLFDDHDFLVIPINQAYDTSQRLDLT